MPGDSSEDLTGLRLNIERIDRELLLLLKERMKLARGVAQAKLALAVPFRDPIREEVVLERVRMQATELGLDAREVERLYRLIMEMAIAQQQAHVAALDSVPLRVAYPGVEGSYAHIAAQQRYAFRPGGVILRGYESLRRAVDAVRRGEADFALLPIENTTAGSMNETYDLLAEGGVAITGEVIAELKHLLLGLPGATVEGLTTILSHPAALAQCEPFLRGHRHLKVRLDHDAASAARHVKEANDLSLGAIAGEAAARHWGLTVLHTNLHEGQNVFTRYVEVAVEAVPCPEGSICKTSLLTVLEDKPGALGEVLMRFARRGVNLTKLESRPQPAASWSYRFYLDVEGHAASREMQAALEDVRPLTTVLRVLGTYAKAEEAG